MYTCTVPRLYSLNRMHLDEQSACKRLWLYTNLSGPQVSKLVLALQGVGLMLSLCSSGDRITESFSSSLPLPAPLLPPPISCLSWATWEQRGGHSTALRSSGMCYKKCTGHTAGKHHRPHINRNGVKAEKEACSQLLP